MPAWNWLNTVWQDLRYASRTMRRSPGFTAVVVASLALGIGANTAIFSLMYTLMLRSLPVEHPERLVEFLVQYPEEPWLNVFSRQSYEHFRNYNHAFSEMTADHPSRFPVRGESLDPELMVGECVAGNFFQMLGVKAAMGRLIGPDDDRQGTADRAVAVISWPYWKSRFNLDPAVLGRRLVVEDVPVTVIGVLPPDFSGLQTGLQTEIWMPLALFEREPLRVIARLKTGVSIRQARAEMEVLFRFTLEERIRGSKDPVMRQLKFAVEPAGSGLTTPLREQFAQPLVAVMAVVALLLFIACTNIAGLLLARAAARQHELSIRIALGASRFRLIRQMLTESLLLSGAGGLLGLFVACFGARTLAGIITSGRFIGGPPRIDVQITPDFHVLLFTGAIALAAGVLFGMAPAWSAFADGRISSLRERGSAGETRLRRLFAKSLVVAQVALSVGLLSAAGLFIRNLSHLENMDLGFRRDHLLLVTLDPPRSGYTGEQWSVAYEELLRRFGSIPGVRSATVSGATPLSGAGASRFVNVEGHPERPEDRRYVALNSIAPKYFETLGTPLLAGREFTFEDRGRPRVAIINQAMAKYYFGVQNPIGKHFTFDDDPRPFEIVGLAGDARYYDMRETTWRTVYLNALQFPGLDSNFAIRTSVAPGRVVPAVRRAVRERLRAVPVARVTTLADQADATIVPERLVAFLSGVFGSLGALLAAIGIYGLLAYTVTRRINEIGVRMALGATQAAISRMIVWEALRMSCTGVAIGALLAFWGERFAASLIRDLPLKSAFPFAFGAATMIVIAVAAAYLPAHRAARIDPMEALRHE